MVFTVSSKLSLFINKGQISGCFSVLLKLEIIMLRMCIMITVLSILQPILFFFIIAFQSYNSACKCLWIFIIILGYNKSVSFCLVIFVS